MEFAAAQADLAATAPTTFEGLVAYAHFSKNSPGPGASDSTTLISGLIFM